MKQLLFTVGILLVAVAVYALSRILPDETVMALVGVMCGIIASIPLSVLLLVALTRDRSAYVSAPVQTMSSDEFWTIETPTDVPAYYFEFPDDPYADAPRVRQLNRGSERDTP